MRREEQDEAPLNQNRHPSQLVGRPHHVSLRNIESADANDEIDLLALLRTIWRGRWIIALVATVAVLLGGYYAFGLATPMYTASSNVVLESRQEQIVDIENVMSGLAGNQETLNTEVEVLTSRGLAEKLVLRMNLLEDPEFNAELRPEPMVSPRKVIGWITGKEEEPPLSERAALDATIDNVIEAMTITNVRQSYVFRITMVTESPVKSKALADTLADVYIEDQLAVKFAATKTATEWLTEQVAQLKTNLEEAEERVKDFNATTTLISPEALEALNRQLKDLRERLDHARLEVRAAEDRLAALSTARNADDPALMAELAGDSMLSRLSVQGADQTVLLARFDALEKSAVLDRDRLQSRMHALEVSNRELEQQIKTQSEDLVQLQQLQREAEASGAIYAYFLTRLKETSVQLGIQQPDSRILSHAVVPLKPSAPKKPLVLALAGLLGVFVGTALVIGREATKNTFRTADQLTEMLGIPVMGTVPRIPGRRRDKTLEYVMSKPTSAAAEAVRNLRTSLMLSNVDNPPQVILSTSAIPGEGKTTQSILLAQNFAALGRKVLLVEGDMRRRVFSAYFKIESAHEQKSLVAILTGHSTLAEAVFHEHRLGIDLLVSTRSKVNAADLYSSEKFAVLVAEMRTVYDIIIIDTPPVLVVPDARVVAGHVDAVIFTVRWDSTLKSQVRDGVRMLESVGIKVSGMVLAQVDPKGMRRYGYQGYGYDYKGYYAN